MTHAYIMKRAHDADGGKQYDLDQAAALKAREDHAKDQARVAAGRKPKKDKTGFVKHIFKAFVFVHIEKDRERAGIYCARSRQLKLADSTASKQMIQGTDIDLTKPNGPGTGQGAVARVGAPT